MTDNNCKSVILAKGNVYQILGMGELNLKTESGHYLTLNKEQVNSFAYYVENQAVLRRGTPFHLGEHLYVLGDANGKDNNYHFTKCKHCCDVNNPLDYMLHEWESEGFFILSYLLARTLTWSIKAWVLEGINSSDWELTNVYFHSHTSPNGIQNQIRRIIYPNITRKSSIYC